MYTGELYFNKRWIGLRSIDTPIYRGYPIYPTFVRLTKPRISKVIQRSQTIDIQHNG